MRQFSIIAALTLAPALASDGLKQPAKAPSHAGTFCVADCTQTSTAKAWLTTSKAGMQGLLVLEKDIRIRVIIEPVDDGLSLRSAALPGATASDGPDIADGKCAKPSDGVLACEGTVIGLRKQPVPFTLSISQSSYGKLERGN
jgi:hypothetical protein